MARYDGKELKRREDCTERQMIAWDMLDAWIGCYNARTIRECGTGIEFCLRGDFSTFDWDKLTTLVLYAHAYRVRVELRGASPQRLRVVLHAREAEGRIFDRHPGLAELAELAMQKQQVR
jgi:hypothetical protein